MVEREKRAKTETLSLRLDPKTRFMLEFMAKVNGQSITVLVERSVRKAAEDVEIGPQYDGNGNRIDGSRWTDFWDPHEGVRKLSLLSNPHYPSDFDEDEMRSFTTTHWPFFYTTSNAGVVRRGYVEVLWDRIEEFLETWRATKATNYWKAGEDMARALAAARIAAPEWPKKPVQKSVPVFGTEGDDDIPF